MSMNINILSIVVCVSFVHMTLTSIYCPEDYCSFPSIQAKYKYTSKQCYKKFIITTEPIFCSKPYKF